MSIRRDPFERIQRMIDQWSRELEEAASSWRTGERGGAGPRRQGRRSRRSGRRIRGHADVSGVEKDEIDIRLLENTLHNDVTRDRTAEQKEETYLGSEREHRSLSWPVAIPEPTAEDDVEATLTNGVLTVRLPEADPTEGGRHRIEID